MRYPARAHYARSAACRVGIAVALVAPWSGSAAAAPVDTASDYIAAHAVDRYGRALLSDLPAGKSYDDAFVASISTACPNALAPIALLPLNAASQSAAQAFGEEVGADLALEADAPNLRPLARLSKTLSKLRWSSQRTTAITARFVAAEHSLFSETPSGLCADASALAANPQATPTGTLQWLAAVKSKAHADGAAAAALGRTLRSFAAPADAPVFTDIVRVANRLSSKSQALVNSEALKLLSALGIST